MGGVAHLTILMPVKVVKRYMHKYKFKKEIRMGYKMGINVSKVKIQ